MSFEDSDTFPGMKIYKIFLLLTCPAALFGCSKKESPATIAEMPMVAQKTDSQEPGVLKRGSVGAVFLLDSNSKKTFKIKVVFPNEQVVGTSAPEGQKDKEYTERRYPVNLESDVVFYDGDGLLGKIHLPKIIEGTFWCENDGGTKYRPELIIDVEKNLLKRPLSKRDEKSGFSAFALVDEKSKLENITYKVPTTNKVIHKYTSKIGSSNSENIQFLSWNDAGAVKYGPYAGLVTGNTYYSLTCDSP